ncbi:unnamed protein product [Leptidea sinapis]|uniref:Uncharacterized protein n=1 Tax=Leptidea sinapis TaxID=189913 RepID=A0A5E4QDX7_9NEOP|nr:unnamed protein product [Leptidea sinapis]
MSLSSWGMPHHKVEEEGHSIFDVEKLPKELYLIASQVPGRPDELFYILLNEKEGLLHCYLFKAATVLEVCEEY